jgi:hypothetical protein
LVLAVAEDGVIDNYAVNGRVVVRFNEAVLEKFAIDFAQVKCEATITALVGEVASTQLSTKGTAMEEVSIDQWTRSLFNTSLARPFRVYPRGRISAGEEADKERLALDLAQTIAHFVQKTLGDVVREDDFAIGFIVGHGGVTLLFGDTSGDSAG